MSLRTDIIDILHSPHCRRINFHISTRDGAVRVAGADYATIARCIENRQIQVVQSGNMASTRAVYNRRFNCILTGSAPSRTLVVHEATHALNDWHRRTLQDVDDEVCAYVAMMVFMLIEHPTLHTVAQTPETRRNTQNRLQQCRSDIRQCNTAVVGEATAIAVELLAPGRRINPTTLAALRQALMRDPDTHTDSQSSSRVYDGIHHQEIPADYLREVQGTVIND